MFTQFYHGTLERLVAAFGSIFNNIYVLKFNGGYSGTEVERILVPINYMNRHAYIARLEAQPVLEDNVKFEAVFPRMAFTIDTLTYDPSRKLNTIHKQNSETGTTGTRNTMYQSVPWNVSMKLIIVAKHPTEANQVLEQILPYFGPTYTFSWSAIPGQMDYNENVPIELESVTPSDNWEAEMDDVQRVVSYEFHFTCKIQFHGPVQTSKIIKHVQVDTLTPAGYDDATLAKTPRIARETIIPDPSNAEPPDPFGYNDTWQEFSDGKKFNPETLEDEDIP